MYRTHFKLMPTSHLIPKGYRMQVCICGADVDHFHPLDEPGANPENLEVFCTKEKASRIFIPMIKHKQG